VKSRSSFSLLIAVALAATGSSLPAQGGRDTTELPALVVTATREPGALRTQTATVSVLDGAALRAEGVTHLADALRRVPGLAPVRTSSFGSQTALFLRGGQGNYVRVLVDGVPLNEPGGVLDLGRVTLDDVERVEVVRGPASVLYGSEAVTGVIQLFTRRGAGPARLLAEAGGGSYGARRGALGAAGGSARTSWSLRGDHHASNGILPFNNGYRNDGAVASLGLVPDGASDLQFTARYNTSVYRFPTGSDGSVQDRNAERTEHRLMVGVEGARRWTPRTETRVQLSSMELRPRSNDGADDAADTLGFFGYFARGTVTRRLADVRTTVRLGAAQRLAVGAELARDSERSTSLSQSEFGDHADAFRAARNNRALYAQALGDLGPLSYTLGGRLDRNSAFGAFRTARAGLAWRVGPALSVRSSFGTAFKAPSFFENFAAGFTVGNPLLRPERSRSAELGAEAVLRNGWRLRVTGFTQRFSDLIQYTGAPPAPDGPNYYNVARANAGGVELEATLPAVFGFVVGAGHTWTDTRVVDAGFDSGESANFVAGGRLLRRPEHVTTLTVSRALADAGTVTLVAVRTGEREDRDFSTWPAGVVYMAPFTTVDLSADLRVPGGLLPGASIALRAENVADVRYRHIAGFDAPGRSLYAGLKLQR
jgi:vitamin B12 transporter